MGEFDAHENVLTMIAHDDTMVNVVGTFPNTSANDWKKKGCEGEGYVEILRGLWGGGGDEGAGEGRTKRMTAEEGRHTRH